MSPFKSSSFTLPTLESQIRRQISIRILICTIIFSFSLFLTILYGMWTSFQSIKVEIDKNCNELANFVISQTLLGGRDAIGLKLESLNNKRETYHLITNGPSVTNSQIKWSPFFAWSYTYPVYDLRNRYFGYFLVTGSLIYDHAFVMDLAIRCVIIILFAAIILSILMPLSSKIPERLFMRPIRNLLVLLKNKENQVDLKKEKCTSQEMYEIHRIMLDLIKQSETQTKEAVLYEMAHQVAHDIRSPLVAMDMVLSNTSELPEDRRTLLRSAITRVHDIANNLLEKHAGNNQHEGELSPVLLSGVLHSMASEKRAQFDNKNNLIIETDIAPSFHSLFTYLNASQLKRILSNLINNGIEAAEGTNKIKILIKLESKDNYAVISISDNGRGIPSEVLNELGKRGMTYGKHKGSGLGLYHAFTCIRAWNGDIHIQSKPKKGTQIVIMLPLVAPPAWFVEKIELDKYKAVVILDDDPHIHVIWKSRFASSLIPLVHTTNHGELIQFAREQEQLQHFLFLLDYEIVQHRETGLDLIEKLTLHHNAILVTSRYEEYAIQAHCMKLNVRLLPKSFAFFVPLEGLR